MRRAPHFPGTGRRLQPSEDENTALGAQEPMAAAFLFEGMRVEVGGRRRAREDDHEDRGGGERRRRSNEAFGIATAYRRGAQRGDEATEAAVAFHLGAAGDVGVAEMYVWFQQILTPSRTDDIP